MVRIGLENFLKRPPKGLQGVRLGLLCNPASVDHRFQHSRVRISKRFPGQLQALYSPQHGFYAEKQDNMVESAGLVDPVLGIPVYSLYGTTRWPTQEMFDPIDWLLVDIQDVGTRVYTFIYTMAYCMEAATRMGKKIVVLDRPNPAGGAIVEGNVLETEWSSFVGRYPVPMRHGMTIGELAMLFNEAFGIGCDLSVVPMTGWKRSMFFTDTRLPWVSPSPNLPTPASALVYPGQVIWEGTNVSEGRGTALPFELMGAPYLNPQKILSSIKKKDTAGVILRETGFEPTSNKWCAQFCRGFQIHVTHPSRYLAFHTSLALLWAILQVHPDQFSWKSPPYEYEHERMPIDLILGSRSIRQALESGIHPGNLRESWKPAITDFIKMRSPYLLYAE